MRVSANSKRAKPLDSLVPNQVSKAHAARVKGGKLRHAKNDCARLRAARLILAMAPAGGWKTEAHVARAIEARLIRFIKARRLSLVCEASLRRTIVRWIHNRPAVRAAYLASREKEI